MKNKLYVKQDDYKDCGVSCLLSIIRYYNGDASKEYLRDLTKTNKDGCNALNLAEAAEKMGFEAFGVRGEIKDIKECLPIIGHVILNKSYQHFVVIYKIDAKKDTVTIMDPSYGFRKLSINEWNSITTKNYLIFKPKQIIPRLINKNNIKGLICPFLKKYHQLLRQIILLSLLYTCLSIITSYSFKLLLDEVSIQSIKNITLIFIILILFNLIKCFTQLLRHYLVNYVDHQLDKIMINDIYEHIINLPYLYYKNRTTGDVITRINDLTNVREFISKCFVSVVIDSLLMITVSIILLKINVTLFVITIIMALSYIIVMLIYNNSLYQHVKKNYEYSSLVNSYFYETISSIDTIKGLCLENKICQKLRIKYSKLSKVNYKLLKKIYEEDFFHNILNYLGNLAIIYLGVVKIKEGSLTITSLVVYLNLLTYFLNPINELPTISLLYKNAKESIKRVMDLYQLPRESLLIDNKYAEGNLVGDIEFRNLSFSYNGLNNVIKNFNCKIGNGERVLLYGSSGSGKSTIMKILNRYLDNYQGQVLVNGNEISVYNLRKVRERICYVSQKEILFTSSIYQNIVLDRDVPYSQFLDISKLMFVDDIANHYALKYDYLLEENGFNLSGGERQRIILARTLLKEADIYIFDEALSAVEIDKEREILGNIFTLLKNKTIIVVSHRFNNSDLFDKKIEVEAVYGY